MQSAKSKYSTKRLQSAAVFILTDLARKWQNTREFLVGFYIDITKRMLYNNDHYNWQSREDVLLVIPIRYFVINRNTDIVHVYGFCQQTKPRAVPIRLFDSQEELETHCGRKLTLCKTCRKELEQIE